MWVCYELNEEIHIKYVKHRPKRSKNPKSYSCFIIVIGFFEDVNVLLLWCCCCCYLSKLPGYKINSVV